MKTLFLILAAFANLGLMVTFWLGWGIEDASSLSAIARQQVSWHFLCALVAVTLALMVHAVVLTYFMGTGRWIEETCAAYRFEPVARSENVRLKYRLIPGMVACVLLLILTGAWGAIADPASNMQMESAPAVHFVLAVATLLLNLLVSVLEYQQIGRNSHLVERVYQEVQAVRRERGLDVTPAAGT